MESGRRLTYSDHAGQARVTACTLRDAHQPHELLVPRASHLAGLRVGARLDGVSVTDPGPGGRAVLALARARVAASAPPGDLHAVRLETFERGETEP